MEDENRGKVVIIIIGVVVAIALIIGIVFAIYNAVMTNKNTDDFYSYLLKEGYKDNGDGTYTKTIDKDEQNIQYLFTKTSFVISKEITDNNETPMSILLTYKSNSEVEGSLEIYGNNPSGVYGSTLQTSTYKNNDFQCDILIDKGFGSKCDILKEETDKFAEEVNDLLEHSNTQAKYIK